MTAGHHGSERVTEKRLRPPNAGLFFEKSRTSELVTCADAHAENVLVIHR